MDAYSARGGAFVEVNGNCLGDLFLQIAEILPLRCDATPIWIVPRRNEPARLLVALDL